MITACKVCSGIMCGSDLQQGNCHIDCYNQETTVFKICLDGTCFYDKVIPENGDNYEITLVSIPHGYYANLPDFTGF